MLERYCGSDSLASLGVAGFPKPSELWGWHAASMHVRPHTQACRAACALPAVHSVPCPCVSQHSGFPWLERSIQLRTVLHFFQPSCSSRRPLTSRLQAQPLQN